MSNSLVRIKEIITTLRGYPRLDKIINCLDEAISLAEKEHQKIALDDLETTRRRYVHMALDAPNKKWKAYRTEELRREIIYGLHKWPGAMGG